MIRIIGFGDTDTTADASKLQAHVVKIPDVNLFLGLGDYPYASRSTKWCSMMDQYYTPELKAKLMLNQGNHEDEESETEASQQDIEKWVNDHNSKHPQYVMPKLDVTPSAAQGGDSTWEKPTWLTSRQVGNVYVINMNTQDMDVEFKRNQYNWVVSEINKAKQLKAEGKIDWIINTAHKPWFTLKSSHSPYTAVRKIYSDLFKDVVDFNLHGHNHNTQMWLPMIADDTTGNGTGTQLFTWADQAQKVFDFTKPHGWLTIVSGHAGHEHNAIKESGNKNCMWYNDSDYGYTQIDIDGKKAHVMAKDITGKVLFEYRVTKEGGVIPQPSALAKLIAPSQVKPGQNVILDGSGSVADTFTITQTLGLPVNLVDAGTFKKSFIVPSLSSIRAATTFQLGFKAEARKGTSQSLAQVSIQVTTDEPQPTSCPEGQCKDRITGICRPIGVNEYKDSNGLCTVNNSEQPPEPICTCPTGWKFDKATHTCIKDIDQMIDLKSYIIGITASSVDGPNIARNAIDGNMNTRWSGLGKNQWLELSFSKPVKVTKLRLAFYRGNTRKAFFSFAGQNFTSSGTTLNFEDYNLNTPLDVASKARIIFNGNTSNLWNSVSELQVWGAVGDGTTPLPNNTPIANAGSDQTVRINTQVTLNGTASTDSDGTITSYFWSQTSGSTVNITNAASSVATFTTPTVGERVFQLRVIDDKGANATDTVRINVIDDSQPTDEAKAVLNLPSTANPLQNVIADASQSIADTVDITETTSEGITFTDLGQWKKSFIIPNKNNFSIGIQAKAIKGTRQSIVQKSIQVASSSTGDVLWDSNVHLKTGQRYTVTGKYGSQDVDGKGVFMAASGSPRLIVEPDGTFYLEADAGHGRVYIQAVNYNARMEGECMFPDSIVRNTTWRLRSRHNEGGDCSQRFGGFGATCERAEQLAEYATEPCHNIHENVVKKPLAKKLEVGKWFKFRYSVCNSADNKTVKFKTEYDYLDGNGWVTVLTGSHNSPKAYYMNEADFKKRSYAWLRINNEKTGKVAYKNVKIIKLNSGALD